jgi:signal peptidase II
MANIHKQNAWWLLITLMVIIIDQLSKYLVLQHLQPYQPVALLPILNMTLAFNTGAAFSFLTNQSGWQRWFFTGIASIVSIYMVIWMLRSKPTQKSLLISLALIIGGAISNVIDRIYHGVVTDFIDFHLGTWHFATFNLADSSITIGAIGLALYLLFTKPTHS